jgi:hypothetical protein
MSISNFPSEGGLGVSVFYKDAEGGCVPQEAIS